MTGYLGSFDRKGVDSRSLLRRKSEYNPKTVKYYSSADELLRVEETWRDKMIAQTISGSNYAENWPSYTYTVVTDPWDETTTSGADATSSGVNHVFIAYPY